VEPWAGRRVGLGIFAGFLVLVVVGLHPTLVQPPVWDTTMGLFPGAIVLSENGFDLPDLLSRPAWARGGPSIHPFSLPTWLTALALRAIPDDAVLRVVLHGVHFAVAAFTLLGTFRLAGLVLGPGLALALSATLFLFPLFQVQAGYLYTEMPLAACTVWAVLEATRRRWGRAVAWSALACFVKEPGVVVAVALALAAALQRDVPRARWGRVAILAAAPALFVALQVGFALPVESATGFEPSPYGVYLADVFRKLAMVPDLAALLAVAALAAGVHGRDTWHALRGERSQDDSAARARALCVLILAAFAGFYALVPLTGVEVYVLPRYYVQIAPLVLLLVTSLALRLGGSRAVALLLALLAILFAVNRSGRLYPEVPGNEFSLAERSVEYRDLLAVQRQLLDAAFELPGDLPVFYGLPEHFLLSYPRMGYAPGPLPQGRCIWLEPHWLRARLDDFPDRFAILYNFVGYGGKAFQSLLRQARADPSRRVEATVFSSGRYRTLLFQVTRVKPPRSPRKARP